MCLTWSSLTPKVTAIHEAKTNLSRLIKNAERGEGVELARGKRPLVRLVPIPTPTKKRHSGMFRGEFELTASLSRRARKVLESFDTELSVSAASACEIGTKVRIGKLPGADDFVMDPAARIESPGFRQMAITLELGQRAGMLPGMQRDPFDRMLVAQAQAANVPILSDEKLFDEYQVQRIW